MRNVIQKVNKEEGKTIFLTTHNMQEATELSDRVAIIDLGKIIAMDTPGNLRLELSKTQHNSITITLNALPDGLLEEIKKVDGVLGLKSIPVNEDSYPWVRVITDKIIVYELTDLFKSWNLKILDIKTEIPTLEDVFLEKTGRTLSENTAIKS